MATAWLKPANRTVGMFLPESNPERAPDYELSIAVSPQQALLYRMCGDRNPLHSDPAFAAIDMTNVQQTAGELDQQISIVQQRIARFEKLIGSGAVPQGASGVGCAPAGERSLLEEGKAGMIALRSRPVHGERAGRGSPAPLDHHLRPLTTYSLPRMAMLHWMFVASEDATSGSVIKNAERISPFISGFSHLSLCARVP